MRRIVVALALVTATTPAWAQTPASPALDLIAQSNATGVFDAVPTDQDIAVRHARSGLLCRLDPSRASRLIVFPQAARGEDVACESSANGHTVTLYATRYSFDATLDQLISGAESAVRRHMPDAQPLSQTIAITSDTLPAHRSAQFVATNAAGARTYVRISVALINGWAIKLRYAAPAADEEGARAREGEANAIWRATLREMAPPPAP